MYSVKFDKVEIERFITLSEAMTFAKTIDAFVTTSRR